MPSQGRILVTGATGFVGRRVCQLWPHALAWPKVDLREREMVKTTVRQLLETHPFDRVLHLAGVSSIRDSYDDPVTRYEVNLMGTVMLLHALTEEGWRGRFLFVSTGAVYGSPDLVTAPLREDTPIAPPSPYAASKAGAEFAVLEWARRTSNSAVLARPFNHVGAGQSSHFFLPSMAQQITAVPRGQSVVVEVGNLSSYRDFLHVDDVIDAYQALLEKGEDGQVYNVAGGSSATLTSILDGLIAASGRRVEIQVRSDRFRSEPSRPLEISTERLRSRTGWAPRRELHQIYADLIDYWEAEHEKERAELGGLGGGGDQVP